jgi:hypothetical protein
MASHTGIDGVLKYDSNAVAELTAWTLEINQEPVESTALGQSSRSFKPGITTWTGSAECFWDETDSAQSAIDTDMSTVTTKTLEMYPEGTTSGDTVFSGTVIISSISRSSSVNGMVTASFNFQGTGGLTKATV